MTKINWQQGVLTVDPRGGEIGGRRGEHTSPLTYRRPAALCVALVAGKVRWWAADTPCERWGALFCSARCRAVPATSSISGLSSRVCGLSSSLPASILERSRTWLMSPSRCVPAPCMRLSGSSAFSVRRAASPFPTSL
jgi:hypothetical protein